MLRPMNRERANVDARSFAWSLLILFSAGALICYCASIAKAGAPTLRERIVAVAPSLASKREPAVDAESIADAIVAIPNLNADWAALVLTVGGHESAFAERIIAGDCRAHECDHGRAWGAYQSHKSLLNQDVWGSPDLQVQTKEAARALRSAFYLCGVHRGKLHPNWVARTLTAYAGRAALGCDQEWPGLQQRVATFKRVRGRL